MTVWRYVTTNTESEMEVNYTEMIPKRERAQFLWWRVKACRKWYQTPKAADSRDCTDPLHNSAALILNRNERRWGSNLGEGETLAWRYKKLCTCFPRFSKTGLIITDDETTPQLLLSCIINREPTFPSGCRVHVIYNNDSLNCFSSGKSHLTSGRETEHDRRQSQGALIL